MRGNWNTFVCLLTKRSVLLWPKEGKMKKNSVARVIHSYDQDFFENKENIEEVMVPKRGRKKNMNKKSRETLLNSSNSGQKSSKEVTKKGITEKFNESTEHNDKINMSLVTKEVQILLRRCDENDESCHTRKKITDTSGEKSEKRATSKLLTNIQDEDKCHSSLKIKEVQIVLERCTDIHENVNFQPSRSLDVSHEDAEGKAKVVPNKGGRGSKRKRGKQTDDSSSDSSKPAKSSKKEKESKSSSKNEKIPDVTAIDFGNDSKSSGGNPWNFKISSWNINGIRAWLEKNGLSYLHHEKPDVLCIQETKCSDDKLPEEVKKIEGYHVYWLSGDKEGYSGVGLLSKEKPIKIEYGIGIPEHDNEGRVITAEYEQFYLVATYVPNAGRGLVRLDYRMKWDKDLRAYLKNLDAEKPVILCGDLNVAHEAIDLANPKTNKKNAGFTKEEREGFSALLKEGFIDTFRHLYPDEKGAYTFWTYMMNARAKNVGWRLDYFVISERFCENLCDNVIRKDVFGSDHCPITLFLSL